MYRGLAIALLCCVACNKNNNAEAAAAPPTEAAAAPVPAAEAAPAKTEITIPKFVISKAPGDIEQGKAFFASKGCVGCHKIGGGKLVGPDLKGVTARREQEWIERMILRPDVMTKEDDTAKQLFATHLVQMPNQGVDPSKELPALLAYLKSAEN
jgi:mono/diheme cytochrome c family protein